MLETSSLAPIESVDRISKARCILPVFYRKFAANLLVDLPTDQDFPGVVEWAETELESAGDWGVREFRQRAAECKGWQTKGELRDVCQAALHGSAESLVDQARERWVEASEAFVRAEQVPRGHIPPKFFGCFRPLGGASWA